MSWIIYHNNRCSKSRIALDYLEKRGIKANVIHYLTAIPTEKELADIINKLGVRPVDIIRKEESEYKEFVKDKNLSDSELIALMVAHPKLIQRPIIIHNNRAVIGRPVEEIEKLI